MGWRNAPAVEPGYLRAPRVEEPTGPQPVGRGERFLMGLGDPIVGGAQLLERISPAPVRNAINAADAFLFEQTGGRLGTPSGADQFARDREAEYQARLAAAGQDGFDGMRLAGNIINPVNLVAAKAAIPTTLAGRLGQGALLGGAFGAIQPVTGGDPDDFTSEKLMQTGVGAATGAAGEALLGPIARAAQRGQSPDVSLLMSEGVRPTGAQIAGGGLRATEDMMRSVPVIGSVATRNQRRAMEQFNEAAIERAVAPVGGNVKGFGMDAIDDAGRVLDQAYDRARAAVVNPVDFDPAFVSQITDVDALSAGLTGEMQRKLNSLMRDNVGARLAGGRVTADQYKTIDSKLGKEIARFSKSPDPTHQEYADVVREVQSGLREQMARTNPDASVLFGQADTGYRQLVILEDAAVASRNTNGVFTPAQLMNSVRKADDTVRNRGLIRGTAPYADLARAGQNVLGNQYPDSGTAGRVMMGAALGGGGVGAVTAPTSAALAGAGLLGATGAYAAGNPLARFALTNPALARTLQAVPTTGAAVGGAQGAGMSGLLMGRD